MEWPGTLELELGWAAAQPAGLMDEVNRGEEEGNASCSGGCDAIHQSSWIQKGPKDVGRDPSYHADKDLEISGRRCKPSRQGSSSLQCLVPDSDDQGMGEAGSRCRPRTLQVRDP